MNASENHRAVLVASERFRAVEELYFRNFEFITELASSDRAAVFAESDAIIKGVGRYLPSYEGDLSDAAFQSWARAFIFESLAFNEILRTCGPSVKTSIWRIIGPCADLGDVQDMADEAEQNTWLWVIKNLDSLCNPRARAKPKTRLFEVARFAALTVRKKHIRERDRFGTGIDVSSIGTEPDNPFYRLPTIIVETPEKENSNPYERCESVA